MKRTAVFSLSFLALAVAVGLSACGGGGGGVDNQGNAGGTGTDIAGNDSFIARVTAIIATNSDSTEPASTDNITATSPETTAPQPII